MSWTTWNRVTACLLISAGLSLTSCCGSSRPIVVRPPASLMQASPALPSPVPVYEAIKACGTDEAHLKAAILYARYVSDVTALHENQEADRTALRAFYKNLEETGE